MKKLKSRIKKVHMDRGRQGFRHEIGVSQQALAGYIGASRSSLNQFERGRNSLTTQRQILFDRMGDIVYALDKYAPPTLLERYTNMEKDTLRTAMQQRIDDCNAMLLKLRIKLGKFRSDYAIACKGLKTACIMMEQLSKEDEHFKRKDTHIGVMETESWNRMVKYGPAAQAELQLQIGSLEFDAAQAKRILEENGMA